MSKITRFLFIVILLFLIASLLPFGTLLGPKVLRDYINRELAHKVIAEKVTQGAKSDEEKAIRLFDYLCTHIFKVSNVYAVNEFPLNDILRGSAYCDQQANTLLWLARKAGIKGRLIFLRGYDEASHHSVCDLYIDGKYRIFDPYYAIIFYDNDGAIATFEDIQKRDKAIRSDAFEAMQLYSGYNPANYYRLYEPTYRPTINTKDIKRILASEFISLYYDLFGDVFVILFQESYFRLWDIRPFFRGRLKHMAFRLDEAIADYTIAISDAKSSDLIRSEAAFYRAQAIWDKGDYNRAILEFNKFSKEHPRSRWDVAAQFYLGNSYERLNDFDKAKPFYLKAVRPGQRNLLRLTREGK
ncbi:MAG: hypothetical protein HQ575_01430 [Candidatus Omnitrophica bacterium]|nr:hypothetical protein [Candidatus Omnitrophota bacterium]